VQIFHCIVYRRGWQQLVDDGVVREQLTVESWGVIRRCWQGVLFEW